MIVDEKRCRGTLKCHNTDVDQCALGSEHCRDGCLLFRLGRLVRRHFPHVDEHEADEIATDAFLRIKRKLDDGSLKAESTGSFLTYAFKTARTVYLNHARKHKRYSHLIQAYIDQACDAGVLMNGASLSPYEIELLCSEDFAGYVAGVLSKAKGIQSRVYHAIIDGRSFETADVEEALGTAETLDRRTIRKYRDQFLDKLYQYFD